MDREIINSKESGAYLILVGSLVLIVFSAIALAVDISHIYRTELRLQRAADAAVLKAMKLLEDNEYADITVTRSRSTEEDDGSITITDQLVIPEAEALAVDNLLQGLSQIRPVNWDPSTNPPVEVMLTLGTPMRVSVSASLDINPYFLDFLPGVDQLTVTAQTAEGIQNKLALALVLDISSSMGWPSSNRSHYDCIGLHSHTDCTPTRYDDMVAASRTFLEQMLPYSDFVVSVEFSWLASSNIINDLSDFAPSSPDGSTNTPLALRRAGEEIRAAINRDSGLSYAKKIVVLLSDGAPSMTSFWPNPTCSGITQNKQKFYLAAIQESDSLRSNDDITIYTIGLGSPNLDEVDSTDPYQNIYDPNDSQKPYFLKRIANDPDGRNDLGQFSNDCIDDYASIEGEEKGFYVNSPTGAELGSAFEAIRRSILSRITQ